MLKTWRVFMNQAFSLFLSLSDCDRDRERTWSGQGCVTVLAHRGSGQEPYLHVWNGNPEEK